MNLPNNRNITNCNPRANGLSISSTDLRVTIIIGIWFTEVNKVIMNNKIKNGVIVLQSVEQNPDFAFSVETVLICFIDELFKMSSNMQLQDE